MSENHRSEISVTLTGGRGGRILGHSEFFLGDEIDICFVDGKICTTFLYRIVGIKWTSEGNSVELQLRKPQAEGDRV